MKFIRGEVKDYFLRRFTMINTVIIADDLTGANDTGAILSQN